jgi:hypothetical protein
VRKLLLVTAIVSVLLLGITALAYANPTGSQGQPNQSCGSTNASMTPGNSANAPGSAFNPNGVSGGVYAGQQPQNSRNADSVAQYDVACFQFSQSHR